MSIFMHSGDLSYSKSWGLKWIYTVSGAVYTAVLVTSHLVPPRLLAGTGVSNLFYTFKFMILSTADIRI